VETRESSTQRWRFGIFEVDICNSELRRGGTPVKLREQAFRILVLLLARAGDIVTREEPCPPTWLAVADLKRIRHNSTVVARLMACYRRIIQACTDEDDLDDLRLTYRTAIREQTQLSLGLLRVLVHLCFGQIGRSRCRADMARVGQHYVNVLLLGHEIVEVLDESCVPVMEEQFLQGLSWQSPCCVNRTAK
jgi:hypothetical protein